MKNKTSFDVLIILAAGLMCFTFLNSYPVSILDESKNVEAAREMIESGDYWIPKFNGELRTDKPPLHYYFMVIGMKLFGVNEFGVRFFSALMGFTLILFFFNFCNRYLDKKQAYISTIIFLSSFFFMHEFRLAVPDPYLITFIALSLFSFFEYFKKKKIKFLILFYFFVALGSLTKGPVAILLPALSVGLFLLLKKQLKNVFSYYPILGIVGVLLVTSPWYINVHLLTDGEWTKGFFIEHNLNRFGSEMEGHGGIFLITFGYVLLGLLPFSFFIPQALINSYKERKNNLILFCSCITLVFVLFFCISSTKLPNYTMPCYPFLIILISNFINKKLKFGFKKSDIISIVLLFVISVTLLILIYFLLYNDSDLNQFRYLSLLFIPTAIGSVLGLLMFLKKDARSTIVTLAFSWGVLLILFTSIIFPSLTSVLPTTVIKNKIGNSKNVVVFKNMDPALPFNFKRTYTVIENANKLKEYKGYYLISNHRSGQELDTIKNISKILSQKALFENNTSVLYKIN